MNQAIFLDRDGVINKAILRQGKPYSPRKFEEFKLNQGVENILRKFRKKGFLSIIITNQPDIARELLKWDEINKMHSFLIEHLPIDSVLICPHDDYHNCECRKPKPGMLFKAANDFKIDLKKSFLIGDRWKDIEAGRRSGCKTILFDASYNKTVIADFRVKDLSETFTVISA